MQVRPRPAPAIELLPKIIMGVDPGTQIMGYALIEVRGQRVDVLCYDVINMKALGSNHAVKLKRIFDRMLELSDLRERASDLVGTLSGGNKQRVNIAIGLLAEPDVLLLDEPSAALDPRQRARLWEFIRLLAGEGTTVIYATHNIQEADRYANQLIVLADGELLFDGVPQALEREVGTTGLDFEEAFVEFLRRRGH